MGKRQECPIIYHPLLVKGGHVIVTARKACLAYKGTRGVKHQPCYGKTPHSNLACLCCGGHLEMYRFLSIELV